MPAFDDEYEDYEDQPMRLKDFETWGYVPLDVGDDLMYSPSEGEWITSPAYYIITHRFYRHGDDFEIELIVELQANRDDPVSAMLSTSGSIEFTDAFYALLGEEYVQDAIRNIIRSSNEAEWDVDDFSEGVVEFKPHHISFSMETEDDVKQVVDDRMSAVDVLCQTLIDELDDFAWEAYQDDSLCDNTLGNMV